MSSHRSQPLNPQHFKSGTELDAVFQKRSAGDVSSWTLKLKGMMWGQLLSAVDGSASSEQCQTPSVAECRNQAVSAVRARMSDGYLLVRESGPLKLAELLGQDVQVAHEHTERIGRGKHQKYSRQHHKANHPYASKTEEAQQIDRQLTDVSESKEQAAHAAPLESLESLEPAESAQLEGGGEGEASVEEAGAGTAVEDEPEGKQGRHLQSDQTVRRANPFDSADPDELLQTSKSS